MSRFLEKVDSPVQVKKLTLEQLQQLAEEIRQEMITTLSRSGGHLGPNLGVVEFCTTFLARPATNSFGM